MPELQLPRLFRPEGLGELRQTCLVDLPDGGRREMKVDDLTCDSGRFSAEAAYEVSTRPRLENNGALIAPLKAILQHVRSAMAINLPEIITSLTV